MLSRSLERYRRLLANYESVGAYALLGVVGGVASGLVVLAFELSIDWLAGVWVVPRGGEGFEALSGLQRFALPVSAAIMLGLLYGFLPREDRETGIVHVISRMHSHYGALPLRNAVLQFTAGAFALASGQSGGREGPGVHLGGAVNSLLGQRLGLPNTSLRTLIACGTAGGIAAAFHTPLAGVIFAMEVIVAEYTVAGFIPVMLASVSALAVSRFLSTSGALFSIPVLELNSLLELPWIALLGISCGLAAAALIRIISFTAAYGAWHPALRFLVAGAVTGTLGLWVPEILGVGYDTLNLALEGRLALGALLLIGLCKLLATGVSVGAGLPIGLIGPSLFIGACFGGALGIIGAELQPGHASSTTLYVIIGMGAAMAAVLNAPLAATLAVIELTHSISLGMPAMLAIVFATLTTTGVCRQQSAHQTTLSIMQRAVPNDPLNKLLHRTDVSSIMDQRAVKVPALFPADDLHTLLESTPAWCVITRGQEDLYMVQGSDLLQWLRERIEDGEAIDLTTADIRRWTLAQVPVQASLRQAMDTMRSATVEAVTVVERSSSTGKMILHGVLSRDSIEKHYLSRL